VTDTTQIFTKKLQVAHLGHVSTGILNTMVCTTGTLKSH